MITKKIGNYELQTAFDSVMVKIEHLMNKENYRDPEFQKMFHVWVASGGVYYFPKERYFVSWHGITNYAIALLTYAGLHNLMSV